MKAHNIQLMRKIAKARGGQCLSEEYINVITELRWRCAKKHVWEAKPRNILSGCWCPECAQEKKRDTIEMMRSIALKHNGKCISKKYTNKKTRLIWECRNKHRWKAAPTSVKQGAWCPICAIERNKKRSLRTKIDIKKLQLIAKKRKGKCLSTEYLTRDDKLKWKCHKGHVWEARPSHIVIGQWCPECANEKKKGNIRELKKLAKNNSGKCLSNKYINNKSKYQWQCKIGHTWYAAPAEIKRGTWCPVCGGTKRKNIEDMRKLAKKRGGKCISKYYVNARTKLKWQCIDGHQWCTTPYNIKAGTWCPICAGRNPASVNKDCA